MSIPLASFGVVSSRTVASVGTNSTVSLISWCPVMDLLCVCTMDGILHVHRLNWQKIIWLEVAEEKCLKGLWPEDDPTVNEGAITTISWRPDGRAIALGLRNGVCAIVSIESKAVVAAWRVSDGDDSSVSTMVWQDFSSDSAPPIDHAISFFPQLPHTESILPDVTHDAFVQPESASVGSAGANILLVGTIIGVVKGWIEGTMECFSLTMPLPERETTRIIRINLSPVSGLVNVITKSNSKGPVQFHSHLVPSILPSNLPLIHQVSAQQQQLSLLLSYLRQSMTQAVVAWKDPSSRIPFGRKSFENRMAGLQEIIDELEQEKKEAQTRMGEEVDTSDTTLTPEGELIDMLLTGVPSYALSQFISRNLSAGKFLDTMEQISSAILEIESLVTLSILPVLRQILWRLEDLRARVNAGDTEMEQPLLHDTSCSLALSTASTMIIRCQTFLTSLAQTRRGYSAFGQWFTDAGIRMVNNEHPSIAPLPDDASVEERDAQAIPDSYGPFDEQGVLEFLGSGQIEQGQLRSDRIGLEIGNLATAKPAVVVSTGSMQEQPCLSHLPEAIRASFPSIYNVDGSIPSIASCFLALQSSLKVLQSEPVQTVSKGIVPVGTPVVLMESASHIGLDCTVAMTNLVYPPLDDHRVAWAWSDQKGEQFLSIQSFHSSPTSVSVPQSHARIIHIPPVPHEGATHSHSKVNGLDWYSPTQLAVLVSYTLPTWNDGAATNTMQQESKLWLLEIPAMSTSEPDAVHSLLPGHATFPLLEGCRGRLFPGTLLGAMSLNSLRSLAAVLIAGRSDLAVEEKSDSANIAPTPSYKPTRRLILLDMDEEGEVDDDADGADETIANVSGVPPMDLSNVSASGGNRHMDGEEEDGGLTSDILADLHNTSQQNQSMSVSSNKDRDASFTSSRSVSRTPSRSHSARSSFGPVTTPAGGKRSPYSGSSSMILSILLCAACLLTLLPSTVDASHGDRDPRFRECMQICQSRCVLLENLVRDGYDASGKPYPLGSDPFSVLPLSQQTPWLDSKSSPTHHESSTIASPQPLSWYMRNIMWWTCPNDCIYQCMHRNVVLRERNGEPVVKYYGKWPFERVLGTQEILSTLFSIINALPHIYWLFRLRSMFPDHYPMKTLWTIYPLVNINTWLWSTVFHARDFVLTERLDYFCASLGISFSLCIAIIRIWGIHTWRGRVMRVFLPIGILLISHIGYLQFIHFDYGWNMKVSLSVGIIHSLVWIYNAILHWSDGYHWRMLIVTIGLWIFASLEVFDFPPYFGLLDAHAAWHGLTPVLGWVFYTWVVEDVRIQLKQAEERRK